MSEATGAVRGIFGGKSSLLFFFLLLVLLFCNMKCFRTMDPTSLLFFFLLLVILFGGRGLFGFTL